MTGKESRATKALRYLATYHKDPPEVALDAFAYNRMLDYVHRVALVGLGKLDGTDDPTYTPCKECFPEGGEA